jgi:formylglycine-generating enzyme required for sulfatase activity
VKNGVSVEPGEVTVGKGIRQPFTATVTKGGGDLVWTVSGGSEGTRIEEIGGQAVLTTGENETATRLTVTAALVGDSKTRGTAVVWVIGNEPDTAGNGLDVSPRAVMLGPEESRAFSARLSGEETEAEGVNWEVSGAGDSAISSGGTLTVGSYETAETLTVTASVTGESGELFGTALVTVIGNEAEPAPVNGGVRLSPQTVSLEKGASKQFEAYDGTNYGETIDSGLSWQVFGAKAPGTAVNNGGSLSVAEGESAERLIVRAKTAGGKYGTAVVTVTEPKIVMVAVPAGSFTRSDGTITLSAFLIGRHEVTQKEWADVMGENTKATDDKGKGDDYPVYKVTWYEAARYCNGLSEAEGLEKAYTITGNGAAPGVTCDFTKNGYRLPTEAEWEYAARGGQNFDYSGSDDRNAVGWFYENSGGKTHPVEGKAPNAYGLYDMSGNVWEWCWDWFLNYPSGNKTDPTGPDTGTQRVNRGGAWDRHLNQNDTVANRYSDYPDYDLSTIGFRVVRRAP